MPKVHRFDLRRIHSEELVHFAVQVRDILHDTLGTDHRVTTEFAQAAEAYCNAIHENDSASIALTDADAVADRAWSAMNYQLQASIRCTNDGVRQAAEKIQAVFEQTDNPTKLNYAAEYGAIRVLLERLEAIPGATHTAARTELALADLRKAYDDFMALSSAANLEASTRVYGVRKETRTQLMEAWKCLTTRLPALVDLQGDDKAMEAIDQINIVVDKYKMLIKGRTNTTLKNDEAPAQSVE